MATPRHPNARYWDFLTSLDPNLPPRSGVDRHTGPPHEFFVAGFPFHTHLGGRGGPPGAGPWDQWENCVNGPPASFGAQATHRGAPGARDTPMGENGAQGDNAPPVTSTQQGVADEKEGSSDTVDVPDPAEVTPEDSDDDVAPWGRDRGRERGRGHGRGHGHGRGRGFGHRGGPGRCGRGGFRRGHHFGPHPPPPPHHHGRHPFDLSGLLHGLAEQFGNYMSTGPASTNLNTNTTNNANAFEPPVDIFNTDSAYVLHFALPGAKKEDVGVSWDPDAGVLRVAGVVHRPGDEAFLRGLASAERTVGVFERTIPLPPAGASSSSARDEVDGYGITAKMEDGLLVVTVPKAEREWTEVHKVDIE